MKRAGNLLSAALAMSVGSVGSLSFWQQDQNYWSTAQQNEQTQSLNAAVINAMFNAQSNLSNGLSSIANQTALSRVSSALSTAVQSALQSNTGSSTSASSSGAAASSPSSNSSGSSSSSSAVAPPSSPATGTGTAPLATSTSLFTLGILRNGAITFSDGTNTTTYKSTGTDTVGDLINAINANVSGNANVAAGLNSSGELVVTSKNDTATITVGGTYASNIGFGAANDAFQPTVPPSSSSEASSALSSSSASPASASSANGSSTGSSTGTTSTSGSSGIPGNSAFALQTAGTAELLLASSGLAGSIVNMLA
jgi:mating pheromone-induced death protein 2